MGKKFLKGVTKGATDIVGDGVKNALSRLLGDIIKEGAFAGEEDYLFFGYVKGFEGELGNFTLGELSTAKGKVMGIQALPIERDRNFKGTLADVMAA